LAAALLGYAHSRLGRDVPREIRDTAVSSKELISDARYWSFYGRLLEGDAHGVLRDARTVLAATDRPLPPEFKWRMAALASAAARALREAGLADALARDAVKALDNLRADWKQAGASYGQRSDLSDLVKRAALYPER
jgi:hypothetical protein